MYKIINLPVGEYVRLFTYNSTSGYHYYWHESLICVDGDSGSANDIAFKTELEARQVLTMALNEYKIRNHMFDPVMKPSRPDYKEFEFEIVEV